MASVVRVISPTIQEFEGVRYYRCGRYFQRKGVRLHRVVWEHFNGPVPDGYAVHHENHDRSDNEPSNLGLMSDSKHATHHGLDRADESRSRLGAAQEAAREWHGSAEGREWHKEQYERHCRTALTRRVSSICANCGRSFRGAKQSKFCGNNCKSAARRAAGTDLIERRCVVCGTTFTVNRHWKTLTCSRSCGGRLARSKD